MQKDFYGLCFINLVDYDMLYGHRNDIDGYAKALTYFDSRLPELLGAVKSSLAILQYSYNVSNGTTSSCAATWNTLSAEV